MSERLEPPKRYDRERKPVREEPAEIKSRHYTKSRNITKLKSSDIFTLGGMDITFFALIIAIVTIGLIMLFSATYPYALQKHKSSYYFFRQQFMYVFGGVIIMLIVSKFDYRLLRRFKIPLLVLTLGLLGLVLVYHTNVGDFKRWIRVPIIGITFQPSDIAKFTLIVVLADYISKNYKRMNKMFDGFLKPLGIIMVFCGLVFLEHHNSGVILLFSIGAALMFCGGSNWKLFALGAGLVGALVVFVILYPDVMQQYAGERIKAWLDKDYEPLGARWQTNNSLYAIGSGNFIGVGLGNSKQKFLYVSEPQNDFIFSIVCEELGFIGAAVIILIYALIFIRGIYIAMQSKDRFASLTVIGIVSQVAIQTVLNILVVTDTIPNTGISLPFFSYGGTSMLMLLFEMGIVLSISRTTNQRKV